MPKQGDNRQLPPEETRFKKGESGNPAGRPKGTKNGLRAKLRRLLESEPNKVASASLAALGLDPKDKTNADAILEVLMYQISTGNMDAIKTVFAQTEEPLKQTVEQTGNLTFDVKLPTEPDADSDD